MANRLFFPNIYCSKQAAPHPGQPAIPGQFVRRRAVRLATAADAPQLCIHPLLLAVPNIAQVAIATARTLISPLRHWNRPENAGDLLATAITRFNQKSSAEQDAGHCEW